MGQDINKPPFKSNQDKLNDRYGNPINKSNDLKVYANTSLKPKSSKKDTVSNYYSPISKKISSYQFKLILDSDGAKLLEMYKQIKPQNNEFYIFIEKNDSYNKYGSIFRLKIGSDLEKNKPSFLVNIVKKIDEKIPSIKDDQIDEVLNSLDEDFTHKFFNWIRNVMYESSFTSVLESIIDFSEDFILPAVEGMRLDDSRWDSKDIKNYNPLIPIPDILKVKDKSKEKFLELVASKTFQAVDTKISTLSKSIELLSNNKKLLNSKSDVSKLILSKLKEAQEAIQFFKSKIDDIHNFATLLYDTMKVATTKLFLVYLQSLNAMVCGLWNSLIDLIYGIISLPILLGKGVLAVINPKNDLKHYWDYAKELYENFLEAKDQIPINEVIGLFFKRSFQEVITIVRFHSERNTLLKFAGSVLVNYSYFCGYLVGFIATFFIEVIFSAGVAAVVDIASKFQKIVQKGASTFTQMSSLIKNEVKNVAEYFKSISILIRRLLGAIQKGKSEFIKMLHKFLDDFWKAVRKSFGVVDEVFDIENLPVSRNKKTITGGADEFTTAISIERRTAWINYLTKRGVKFEIGTKWAKLVLDNEQSNGLVREAFDALTKKMKVTVFLHEPPGGVSFLEECRHALQRLKKIPQFQDVTHEGKLYKQIDFWEYDAKTYVLEHAERNFISKEEVELVKKQLIKVLNKDY